LRLALSHYHGNHIANASQFAKSTWIVQKGDWNAIIGRRTGDGARRDCGRDRARPLACAEGHKRAAKRNRSRWLVVVDATNCLRIFTRSLLSTTGLSYYTHASCRRIASPH
jgi:hypothetical protein